MRGSSAKPEGLGLGGAGRRTRDAQRGRTGLRGGCATARVLRTCTHVMRFARISAFEGSGKPTYLSPLLSETKATRVCKHQNLTCGVSHAPNAWKQYRQPSSECFSPSREAFASLLSWWLAPWSNDVRTALSKAP